MDTIATAQSSYSLGHHKRLHLVRHAEGVHNQEPDKTIDPITSFKFLDAELSSLGWQQVRERRNDVVARGLLDKIEVVVTSPMSRTLQTAVGIFHGEGEDQQPDSFEANAETAIQNRLPIIAFELCRERMGKYECDKRGSIKNYVSRFPAVDFSLIENEDDIFWKADEREPKTSVTARVIKFIQWLWARNENEIAVVSHGVFLQLAMIELIKNNKCYPLMEADPCSRFKNCELRSMIISYESVMGLGSDCWAANKYCGRIPHGIQLQRDSAIAKDNVSVEEVTN